MAARKRDEDRIAKEWYTTKSALMAAYLGPEHDVVMHAIFPYCVGGGLDLYYYPSGLPGTAIATKELSELPGEGSSNRVYQCYELVMFTRLPLDLEAAQNARTKFGKAHASIDAILNAIAPYSAEATLNPNETCEFPADLKRLGGRCLIFDGYTPHPTRQAEPFGLLAIIEIFPSEMRYAMKHGGAKLIKRLKSEGHYPYSDLAREPVA